MGGPDWRLEGEWIKNCNCAFGCPCDFNAPPTHGSARALLVCGLTRGISRKQSLTVSSSQAQSIFRGHSMRATVNAADHR